MNVTFAAWNLWWLGSSGMHSPLALFKIETKLTANSVFMFSWKLTIITLQTYLWPLVHCISEVVLPSTDIPLPLGKISLLLGILCNLIIAFDFSYSLQLWCFYKGIHHKPAMYSSFIWYFLQSSKWTLIIFYKKLTTDSFKHSRKVYYLCKPCIFQNISKASPLLAARKNT